METSRRRAGLAFLAIATAGLILRGQISAALIVRGDELLVRNSYTAARARYERAFWLDPQSETAVDRLTFVAMQQRTRSALSNGVAVASRYLREHPNSAAIRFDRGLCLLLLKAYRPASEDFKIAAGVTRSAQQFVFAGWAAKRSGHVREAVTLWRLALAIRHRYRPALLALREVGL